MKIYILRKSLSNLKTPIVRNEYYTSARTIREFIEEMVKRNYDSHLIKDSLENCIQFAVDDFSDHFCYIINVTQNVKYKTIDDSLNLCEEDEIMFVKLKLVRGIIW